MDSLLNNGLEKDFAEMVLDQLLLYELQDETGLIQDGLEDKSRSLRNMLIKLYDLLVPFVGLKHTLPTERQFSFKGRDDGIDLNIDVQNRQRTVHLVLLWKTHNLHKYETLSAGFQLGNLDVADRKINYLEAQLPLLSIHISREQDAVRKNFFHKQENVPESEICFRVNRSLIEGNSCASDGELDSTFRDCYAFIDFLSDNFHYSDYGLILELLRSTTAQIAGYMARKKSMLDKMSF